MNVHICNSPSGLGESAAALIARKLSQILAHQDEANLLVSTGASQFETLKALTTQNLDWRRINMYHLDEYAGIEASHFASFCRYLTERLVSQVPLRNAMLIHGKNFDETALKKLNEQMKSVVMDIGIIGIGENAHIAFNDPPADFIKDDAYHLVTLSETCKKQQVGEGWFKSVQDVPTHAISMTCRQIFKCKCIVSPVPHKVKAEAINKLLTASGRDNMVPATLLLAHPDFTLFLDNDSASLIDQKNGKHLLVDSMQAR